MLQFEYELREDEEKLFECIPDRWFVDETKTHCYWPPLSSKAFSLRAVNCEKPDIGTCSVEKCTVISEGHRKFKNFLCLMYKSYK